MSELKVVYVAWRGKHVIDAFGDTLKHRTQDYHTSRYKHAQVTTNYLAAHPELEGSLQSTLPWTEGRE